MTLLQINLRVYLRHVALLSGTLLITLTGTIPNVGAEESSPSAASKPTKATKEPSTPEVRALTFKGVEAGTTTMEELKEAWGSPTSTLHDEGLTIHVYDLEPFQSVEVNVERDRVASVVIYLSNPMLDSKLAEQLKLGKLRGVAIVDEHEELLGKAYPERGVTFGFHPEAKQNMVAHIFLEPISAEPFVLRAQADNRHQYQQTLGDLAIALELEPENAEAHFAKAQVLQRAGKLVEAGRAIDQAVELDVERLDFLLTRARISLQLGQYDAADKDVRNVLARDRVPAEFRAQALLTAGDLILNGPNPDFQEAMSYHQRAIDAASPLANDNRYAVRRAAKEILVHAHVAVAKEVAFGDWKNKQQVVPKWLDRSAAIAEELISHDQGDPLLRLAVSQDALAALTGIRHEVNPQQIADATIRRAEKLESEATDPIFQHEISWRLGKALLDVLRIEHARGETDSAKKYGWQAVKLLESAGPYREESPEHSLLLGEAYFRLGSVYAILLNDHATAVSWYSKASPLLEKPRPVIRPYQDGQVGEWFVSMGVSYWEMRDREQAIDLTQFGVRLMEGAMEHEGVPGKSLEIPYSNLAHMYKQIGDDERAKQFDELMAKASGDDSEKTTTR